MSWRLHRAQYEQQKGARNKAAFKRIVVNGPPPGVLAYAGAKPVGWCALAPREVHARLENSRVLARVDGQPVWSVTCFFVAKSFRRAGVSVQLLKAGVDLAAKLGARMVEGYPVEPKKNPMPDVFAWTGIASAFRKAGFKEVARRSPVRPVMRFELTSLQDETWSAECGTGGRADIDTSPRPSPRSRRRGRRMRNPLMPQKRR
jgi:GNAT superfamily N-acetyltransferase